MRHHKLWWVALIILLVAAAVVLFLALRPDPEAHGPQTPALPTSQPTTLPDESALPMPSLPAATSTPTPPVVSTVDPYTLLSQETLLGAIDALTSIQPYSGWRNSASSGESEALDYVRQTLDGFGYLASLGLEQERQSFEVPLGTELWEARLELTLDGTPVQVPASGLRGSRSDPAMASNFDSDGILNDSERNPVVVEGPVAPIRSADELDSLAPQALQGRVVLLDYAVVDPVIRGGMEQAVAAASSLLAQAPAGLVLVTHFSNEQGESHGIFAEEGGALSRQAGGAVPPTVVVRLEDLTVAGIEGWDGLARVQSAILRWDADILAPAMSGNLVARIPGRDPSRAVILGAHIDSPNNPGAMDDGSGSAVLLEIARVLDAGQVQPPTDLYLAWFGSEELGLLGSAHFVSTHQDVLSRTAAMLQIDCLTYPLEGIDAQLTLVTWTESSLGAERLTWPATLSQSASLHGVTVDIEDVPQVYSDNNPFDGFAVPNADLIFMNEQAMEATGSLHHAAHIHDPYDTLDLAQQQGDVLEQMARVALTAALEPPP
jgi:hypothetical protein